jgi:hypothetical protein
MGQGDQIRRDEDEVTRLKRTDGHSGIIYGTKPGRSLR